MGAKPKAKTKSPPVADPPADVDPVLILRGRPLSEWLAYLPGGHGLHLSGHRRDQHFAACMALEEIGPGQVEAIPDLIQALRERPDPATAAALARFGLPALEPLMELFRTGNERRREFIASAFAEMGPIAAPAVAMLTEDVSGPGDFPGVSWEAVRALGSIGTAAAEAVPRIIAWAEAAEHRYREGAIAFRALGRIGPAAAAALPMLHRYAVHEDAMISGLSAAVEAIARIAEPAESLPVLMEALQHSEDSVRLAAAQAIVHLGTHAGPAAGLLHAATTDREKKVRRAAAKALARIRTTDPVLSSGDSPTGLEPQLPRGPSQRR